MSQNPADREEIESLLAARQELGPAMEPALVDSFANKIMAEVQRQTHMEREVQKQQPTQPGTGGQLALGIVSLGISIPLTAIALSLNYPWMAVVMWVGIVLVNFAFTMRNRGPS